MLQVSALPHEDVLHMTQIRELLGCCPEGIQCQKWLPLADAI